VISGPTIAVEVVPASAPVGQTVTVNLRLYGVEDLFGVQTRCVVDPAVLRGMAYTGADGFNADNAVFIDQTFGADGLWPIAATRLNPNPPINGDALAFSLSYTVESDGSTPVVCEAIGVDRDGRDVLLNIQHGSFNGAPTIVQPTLPPATPTATPLPPTATPTVQPGGRSAILGTASYPNAPDNAGITVELLDMSGALLAQVVTTAEGTYRFNDVSVGRYALRFSAPLALTVYRAADVTADGTVVNLNVDVLPMGDSDASGRIDLLDATLLGANYGVSGDLVPTADLNRDGVIDIRDLVLMGSSFGLEAPVVRR
jgi:hypothetical protein